MTQPRAADDFAMIRARMKELRRERERAEAAESELQSDPPARPGRIGYWSQREVELRRDRCDDLGRREWGDQLTP
jgi:hypothetical protein